MATTYLKTFIQHVPACFEADSLACLEKLFAAGTHQAVVIIDGSHRPSGSILLNHWLSYASSSSAFSSSMTSEQDAPRPQENDIRGRQARIYDVTGAEVLNAPLLELSPVAIAPDYWSLEQFRDHAQLLDYLPNELVRWVVVDRQGAYLGILDECAVWRSLALAVPAVVRSPLGVVPDVGGRPWSPVLPPEETLQSYGNAIRQGVRFALADVAESTDILTHLIESLPLPLMVQTTDGQTVLHNTPWQQHISNLQNLDTLQHQMSGLLDDDSASDAPPLSSPPQQFCEMGYGSNECVCTCITADGGNQTWKFIKVPLTGVSLLDPGIAPASADLPSAIASSPSQTPKTPFHLAEMGNPSQKGASVSTSTEPAEPTGFQSPHPSSHGSSSHRSSSYTSDSLWLVVAQDVTAHHRVTQSLTAQNETLEQSNRLKDEFLHCITHELKTPLTSMLGLSSLLKDQAIGSLNERQIQYAHLIYKSGRQLVSLVNNILDLTRLETGEFHLNFDVVNVRSICEQAYREALEVQDLGEDLPALQGSHRLHTSNASAVSFILDIQPGLHHTVADGLRLKQMLVQLLSNALKFSYFQGRIELHVSLWESWLAFTITDQGVGIPLDKQHLIFQKFQQVEHSMTRTFEGAGLGLVLVQKLAEMHGGDISFTSEDGQGSQFTLLLPAAPPLSIEHAGDPFNAYLSDSPSSRQAQQREQLGGFYGSAALNAAIASFAPQPSSSHRLGLAVVVESSASALKTITRHLNHLGYRVVVARSGTEALGKIRRLQPTVILLSLAVPMLSGLDVLLLLKTDAATRHIPIITLSSASELQKAKDLGADVQLEYPIGATDLYSSLHQVRKGHREPMIPAKSTTVLYLNPDKPAEPDSFHEKDGAPGGHFPLSTEKLNALVHPLHCRVLEVDDMEQAELLSQVWKPNVILLSNTIADCGPWLAFLNQSDVLAHLPVVTLTLAHTEAANRTTDLNVFPCLNFDAYLRETGELGPALSPLVEVIQIASGVYRVPHVVVLKSSSVSSDTSRLSEARYEKRLDASVQYLQTAGIHVVKSDSLGQSLQDIDQHTVDLLLVCCSPLQGELEALAQELHEIRQADETLPILLWADDEHISDPLHALTTETAFGSLIESLSVEVIRGRLPMNEILTAVSTAIAHR